MNGDDVIHAGRAISTAGAATIGLAIGAPAAIAIGATLATFRWAVNSVNTALIFMILVVAIAALGGRVAGLITALVAVMSFDFFHTEPYLSMAMGSRDDIETTVLLLVAGLRWARSPPPGASPAIESRPPATRSSGSTESPKPPPPDGRRRRSSPSPVTRSPRYSASPNADSSRGRTRTPRIGRVSVAPALSPDSHSFGSDATGTAEPGSSCHPTASNSKSSLAATTSVASFSSPRRTPGHPSRTASSPWPSPIK